MIPKTDEQLAQDVRNCYSALRGAVRAATEAGLEVRFSELMIEELEDPHLPARRIVLVREI